MPIVIPNKVNPLVLSYPDFTLNSIINPDEFDQNNLDLQDKLNEVAMSINAVIDSTVVINDNVNLAINTANATTALIEGEVATLNEADTALQLQINQRVADLENHKFSNDHDSKYYNKEEAYTTFVSRSEIDTKAGIKVNSEVFRIVNADLGNGTFSYLDSNDNTIIGSRDANYQYFTLLKGDYTLGENRVTAIINDTLHRTSVSGGLIESNSKTIGVSAEMSGAEVTINYFSINGSLGSGIVVGTTTPITSYFGKIWIDTAIDPN